MSSVIISVKMAPFVSICSLGINFTLRRLSTTRLLHRINDYGQLKRTKRYAHTAISVQTNCRWVHLCGQNNISNPVQHVRALAKVPPLTDLPDSLLAPSKGNLPPLFRYGYPVDRKILGQLATVKRKGGEFVEGMRTIRELVDWDELDLVGVLNEGFYAIIEFRNSYDTVTPVPSDVTERVRELLGEEGPPKWYLDGEKFRWTRLV